MSLSPMLIGKWIGKFSRSRLANAPTDKADIAGVAEEWMEFFGDRTDAEFEAACEAHWRSSRFWPAPSDLKMPNRADSDQDAWDELIADYRDHNQRSTWKLRPHQLRALVFLGDWQCVRESPTDQILWLGKRFVERCKAHPARPEDAGWKPRPPEIPLPETPRALTVDAGFSHDVQARIDAIKTARPVAPARPPAAEVKPTTMDRVKRAADREAQLMAARRPLTLALEVLAAASAALVQAVVGELVGKGIPAVAGEHGQVSWPKGRRGSAGTLLLSGGSIRAWGLPQDAEAKVLDAVNALPEADAYRVATRGLGVAREAAAAAERVVVAGFSE